MFICVYCLYNICILNIVINLKEEKNCILLMKIDSIVIRPIKFNCKLENKIFKSFKNLQNTALY